MTTPVCTCENAKTSPALKELFQMLISFLSGCIQDVKLRSDFLWASRRPRNHFEIRFDPIYIQTGKALMLKHPKHVCVNSHCKETSKTHCNKVLYVANT